MDPPKPSPPSETQLTATDIVDSLPFPALLVDDRRRVLYANRVFVASFGEPSDSCDALCLRLAGGDGSSPECCPLDEAVKTGRSAEHVFHHAEAGRWLAAGVYPTETRPGDAQQVFLHTIRDVSDTYRAREAKAVTDELYRSLAEAADDQIFIIDADDLILYVNPNAARQFGLTPEELIGRRQADVFPPEVSERQRARIAEVLETGERIRSESRVWFGERSAWLDTVLVPLPRHDGASPAVMGVSRDITARRAAEERLKEAEVTARANEARLRRVVDTSPTVIYTLAVGEETLTPDWVSENLTRLFGFDPGDVLRADWWASKVHPEDLEAALAAVPKVLATGEASHEYRMARADGEYRWVHDELRLMRDQEGRPLEVVGVWLDITERKRVEALAEESERRLRESQRMEAIGVLAGGIAHDFNNLLTAIGGYADLLMDDPAVARTGMGELDEIRRAVQRAGALVQQLLAFSRRQTLRPVALDVNRAVTDMRRMLERVLGEDVQILTSLDPALGCAQVDPGQFEQVVLNLASNARDAMPTGGRLEFETAVVALGPGGDGSFPDALPGEYIRLRVRDSGLGMDEATLSRAIEPFFTTKPPGHGTGLGLSSVYGITRQSGGHVSLESAPAVGTTVGVYLPRISSCKDTGPAGGPGSLPGPGGTETVLVVEDEEAVLHFATRVLTSLGYQVLSAGDPHEAARVAEEYGGPIHLLLSDVVLPHKGGPQLARELNELRPDMRVLYMSGHARDAMISSGRLEEGIGLLSKPFTRAELADRVRQELDA